MIYSLAFMLEGLTANNGTTIVETRLKGKAAAVVVLRL